MEEEDDDDDMMCITCYNKCGYMFLLHFCLLTPKIYSSTVYSQLCCSDGGFYSLCVHVQLKVIQKFKVPFFVDLFVNISASRLLSSEEPAQTPCYTYELKCVFF